jgi:hypothetical protein
MERAKMGVSDYPNLWKRGLIQRRVRERAGHCCEHCGMEFVEGTNLAVTARRRNGMPVIGTVHHLDGNPANCTMANLLYCCQICHLHIQALWHPGATLPLVWENQPPRWLIDRGLLYVFNPQLSLWERIAAL